MLKDYILNTISQEDIFIYYLEVSLKEIQYCLIRKSNKVRNPRRIDIHPSLGFFKYINKRNEEILICKDFADETYCGDCFQVVGNILNKNSNKNTDFIFICEHIIKNVIINEDSNFIGVKTNKVKVSNTNTYSPNVQITIHATPFLKSFKKYWDRILYFNTEIMLNENHIHQAKLVFVDKELVYQLIEKDFAIAYYLGYYELGLYKIYRPYCRNKEFKFKTNNKIPIEFITELNKNDILIICKARKEVIILRSICKKLGITNIDFTSITSESNYINDYKIISYINSKYNNIYTWLDSDKVGLLYSFYLEKAYNFKSVLLRNNIEFEFEDSLVQSILNRISKFHFEDYTIEDFKLYLDSFERYDFKSKDISDLIYEIGKGEALHIIEKVLYNLIRRRYDV